MPNELFANMNTKLHFTYADAADPAKRFKQGVNFLGHIQKAYSKQKTLEDKVWPRITKTDTCWLWTGGDGVYHHGQHFAPAVVTFKVHVGVWPNEDGKMLTRTCGTKKCVRPEHMKEFKK